MSTTIIHTDKNSSSVSLTLDVKQVNLLIETLLFSSSVNIGAEWDTTDFSSMINLAKELKKTCNNNVELNKICFYKEENYEDNWSADLFKTFKKNIKVLELQNA